MEDAGIVALYWARDERAIAETAAAYGPYCFAIAHNILRSREDADECLSDAWLRAWNAIPPERPARLAAFLARVTRNLALNRLTARAADKRGGGEAALALDELLDCVPAGDGTEAQVELRELEGAVNAFLYTLPVRDRALMVGRYFRVEPVKTLAKRFGMSESAVKVALHRARGKLRTYLNEEGFL